MSKGYWQTARVVVATDEAAFDRLCPSREIGWEVVGGRRTVWCKGQGTWRLLSDEDGEELMRAVGAQDGPVVFDDFAQLPRYRGEK